MLPPSSGQKIKPGKEMSMDIWEAEIRVFLKAGKYLLDYMASYPRKNYYGFCRV
jgi:hypothetical protein